MFRPEPAQVVETILPHFMKSANNDDRSGTSEWYEIQLGHSLSLSQSPTHSASCLVRTNTIILPCTASKDMCRRMPKPSDWEQTRVRWKVKFPLWRVSDRNVGKLFTPSFAANPFSKQGRKVAVVATNLNIEIRIKKLCFLSRTWPVILHFLTVTRTHQTFCSVHLRVMNGLHLQNIYPDDRFVPVAGGKILFWNHLKPFRMA